MKKRVDAEMEESPIRVYDRAYFDQWLRSLRPDDPKRLWAGFIARKNKPKLDFSFEVSSVYSSNIEGNSVDLNSYLRSKTNRAGRQFKRKEIGEIDALVDTYRFAKEHALNEKNLLAAHAILSTPLLPKRQRGRYRNQMIGVFSKGGLEYAAIEPQFVAAKMKELTDDVRGLRKTASDAAEVFYHAALLHLSFVHIHPFDDGNGRMARLLEKWFLAGQLGSDAWRVRSEAYYREHLAEYYRNINLGLNYYVLRYDRCVPFLTMLARSLKS
ncbi:MAG: Fic family protein [Blastocatellia bacterium]